MTSAGTWKQSDLPLPVGITASALRPASSASITASCPGRNAGKPNTSDSTRRAAVIAPPPPAAGPGRAGDRFAHQATAPRPFFATSIRSFSEAPRGRFSPRSHWLTRPAVTLR